MLDLTSLLQEEFPFTVTKIEDGEWHTVKIVGLTVDTDTFYSHILDISKDTADTMIVGSQDPKTLAMFLRDMRSKMHQQLSTAARRVILRERLLSKVLLGESSEKTVQVEYSGYSDSGNIDSCSVNDPDVADFLWDVMYQNHSGFEINSGGNGTVTWHLIEDRICVTHNDVIESYDTSEWEC